MPLRTILLGWSLSTILQTCCITPSCLDVIFNLYSFSFPPREFSKNPSATLRAATLLAFLVSSSFCHICIVAINLRIHPSKFPVYSRSHWNAQEQLLKHKSLLTIIKGYCSPPHRILKARSHPRPATYKSPTIAIWDRKHRQRCHRGSVSRQQLHQSQSLDRSTPRFFPRLV